MRNQYFLLRTLPKPFATSPALSGSAREPPAAAHMLPGGPSGALAPARAESSRPHNWSLVFLPACLHKLITDSSFFLYLKLSGRCSERFERHIISWRPQALFRPSSRKLSSQAPARAETGRPQNWSRFFFVCIINDGPSTQSSCEQMADCQARWRDRSSAALWVIL